MVRGNANKRRARQMTRRARENALRAESGPENEGNFEEASAMDLEDSSQEGDHQHDDRRRNTSSEDEGDGDDGGQGRIVARPVDMSPDVANLVYNATQMIGSSEQDGTAIALAASTAATPTDALNLLAASAAMANVRSERASRHAAQAVVESNQVTRGLNESDVTYDNRFNHYDQELQRLKDRVAQLEIERLTDRVAVLERLLSRVISWLRNGNIDATEIEQMLQNLGI